MKFPPRDALARAALDGRCGCGYARPGRAGARKVPS